MKQTKILFPICSSENSANGLKYAISLARAKKSELDILSIQRQSNGNDEIPHKDIISEKAGKTLSYNEIVREGEVSVEILKRITETEPDLIIMSPDIFHKEKKYFEDSETGKVLQKSNYPILIIPPRTEFKIIQNIIFATEMNEDIIRAVQELLKIFRDLSPHISILTFTDKISTWHFKTDVLDFVQKVKNCTEYENISGNICDHQNTYVGVDLYAEETNTDLICLEKGGNLFHNLFFKSVGQTDVSYILNKPILILPKYWEEMLKKA
jgi:hypothetical protein